MGAALTYFPIVWKYHSKRRVYGNFEKLVVSHLICIYWVFFSAVFQADQNTCRHWLRTMEIVYEYVVPLQQL